MELNENLQILIDRAWDLHDKISDIINGHDDSFCRLICSEHSNYCGVAETRSKERERLIGIRDSLKDVENLLMFLQRLKSSQEIHQLAAMTRLEESRIILIEMVNQYQGQPLEVIEVLNNCFGDGNSAYNSNLQSQTETKSDQVVVKNRISCFVIKFLRSSASIAIKFILVSASLSLTINFCQTRQGNSNTRRKIFLNVDPTAAGKHGSLERGDPNRPLDVSYGKG